MENETHEASADAVAAAQAALGRRPWRTAAMMGVARELD